MSDKPEAPDARPVDDERERLDLSHVRREHLTRNMVLPLEIGPWPDITVEQVLIENDHLRALLDATRAERGAIDAKWAEWQRASGGWIKERADLLAERDTLREQVRLGYKRDAMLTAELARLRESHARLLGALKWYAGNDDDGTLARSVSTAEAQEDETHE